MSYGNPGTNLFKAAKLHRTDTAFVVTDNAIFVDDSADMAVVSDFLIQLLTLGLCTHKAQGQGGTGQNSYSSMDRFQAFLLNLQADEQLTQKSKPCG